MERCRWRTSAPCVQLTRVFGQRPVEATLNGPSGPERLHVPLAVAAPSHRPPIDKARRSRCRDQRPLSMRSSRPPPHLVADCSIHRTPADPDATLGHSSRRNSCRRGKRHELRADEIRRDCPFPRGNRDHRVRPSAVHEANRPALIWRRSLGCTWDPREATVAAVEVEGRRIRLGGPFPAGRTGSRSPAWNRR